MTTRTKITAAVIAGVALVAVIIAAFVIMGAVNAGNDAFVEACYDSITAGKNLSIEQLGEAIEYCEEAARDR